MNLHRNHMVLIGLGTLIMITALGLWYLRPSAAGAQDGCAADWYLDKSREVRDRCSEVKYVRSQQDLQKELAAQATKAAAMPTAVAEKPQKFDKPNVIQVEARELSLDKLQDSALVGITSIWQIKLVPSAEQTMWEPLYLMAFEGEDDQPTLETRVMNAFENPAFEDYEHQWLCPKYIGAITITGIDGSVEGLVDFTSTSGVSGTFDMINEVWSFDP